MKSICVYCGASLGNNPAYVQAAREVGKCLAEKDLLLVYGGSNAGLMGVVSSAVRENGGRVKAVMSSYLYELTGHKEKHELEIVEGMHERKQRFFELSDAFIALPGGYGTLDEMFEMLTWGQLGHHAKPCGFLDVDGYYSDLFRFLDRAMNDDLISERHRGLAIVSKSINKLLAHFKSFSAVAPREEGA